MNKTTLEEIRKNIIGNDTAFQTPFGLRHLFYADYTASGRGLKVIEDKLYDILAYYANSHTEDDFTGKQMTTLLHHAEYKIKEMVNAGEHSKMISVGSGTTGAVVKLQQILGIYIPPVTKKRLFSIIEKTRPDDPELIEDILNLRPLIFISPYEHHTNELLWRESFSETVIVNINKKGLLDLNDLEKKITDPKYQHRPKMASISAGSNITGLTSETYDIARTCHEHSVPILFDFAAIAPYVKIDMNRDEMCYYDAIFFSPHKFLGGPGSSGIVIFNEQLYDKSTAPTVAAGGTVDYVGYQFHDFSPDIEIREKAGTPPILQTIKTALAMEVKELVGVDVIHKQEKKALLTFIEGMQQVEGFELIGNIPVEKRVPIISFNIKHDQKYLHPKFVTKLLNDLFGIQSRAGCSCAGPYGHYLMGIDEELSQKYRKLIAQGYSGVKPGWVRVNLHYTFTASDLEFLMTAIKFVVRYGYLFLSRYKFNLSNGEWIHEEENSFIKEFSICKNFKEQKINLQDLAQLRSDYLAIAEKHVNKLKDQKVEYVVDRPEIEAIKFFNYVK